MYNYFSFIVCKALKSSQTIILMAISKANDIMEIYHIRKSNAFNRVSDRKNHVAKIKIKYQIITFLMFFDIFFILINRLPY